MTDDYRFSIPMRVRATDLNYGNHVAYYNYLLYFQEARVEYLAQFGCTELDIGGFGMIISEAQCRYKRELVLGDRIEVFCNVSEIHPKRFTMHYLIQRQQTLCAEGVTINLCFDNKAKRVARLPEAFIKAVAEFEKLETDPSSS
jgi:YbgC/YbaW family acyl-CoA thioester hydrolase